MRKQFQCELDDFVETQLRFMARSGALRAYFWRGLGASALFCALAALALTAFVFEHWSDAWKLLNGAIGAALGAGLHLMTYQGELKSQISNAWHGTSGGDELLTCEIELIDSGIRMKHRNTQSTHEWAEVEEVREGTDSIDIFLRGAGCGMAVHKRIFTSPEEKEEFMQIIERNSSARVTRV